MKARRFSRGEVSLGYVLKYGLGAGLVLLINAAFDHISGAIYTYKVQLMANSPYVSSIKDCVNRNILIGSYSRLGDCSGRSDSRHLNNRQSPVDVGLNGEIRLSDVINGVEVNLTLKPVFGNDGEVRWRCSGRGEKYLPDSCVSAD